ncbi:hypothetical protein SAMN04487857_110125 [Pseudomonas sp. ok272]|uniref:dermonecrotic toxin domain-containing protein n=1 Tax=unclassified Pseudomonas TaxID=196821 RepID=UPI0008C794FF|nr:MULTISPECIES: DUF6543 domain-containing protein [unclassified Pseudomonas]SEN13185.1 hypothetical protein SAMN04487857_110125 [Pseudomonas sp. ok272]SFN05928.1 hypothetical protein SAMN04487858_111126 [Pseudomonas sp. ok602]
MQNQTLSPELAALLNASDSPAQTALRHTLTALDQHATERFAQQPTFHAFVQQAFDQHFADLSPRLDLLRSFIHRGESPASADREVDTAPDGVPQANAEAPSLLPSLMDAVVQRVVSQQSADYAATDTRFYRSPEAGAELTLERALTGSAFDAFLDQMAGDVPARYSRYVDAYWARPCGPTDARSHKQWLIESRTRQLHAEVALLKSDGLLSAAGQSLFNKVLRYPDAAARQVLRGYRPGVYAVALKDSEGDELALHGAFILASREPPGSEALWDAEAVAPVARAVEPSENVGLVLLFTPNGGLEEFDALASLDRELHRRLRHGTEVATLLALMADEDHAQGLALHRKAAVRDLLRYPERLDSPLVYGIEAQCRLIEHNRASTIAHYQARAEHADRANLPRALDRITDLRRAFSTEAILHARLRKRGQARLVAFLKDASAADRDAWTRAFSDYSEELANLGPAEGLPSLDQFSDRQELLTYGNRQLRIALESEHGLTVNPDDIIVHTQEPNLPTLIMPPGAPASTIRDPSTALYVHRQRTLTELALDNLGSLDFNFTNFSRLTLKPEGASEPLRAYEGLTLQQVKNLIRTVNVGQGYQDFLKANLITSAAALAHKHTFARVLERQLRLDAIEAKINGDFLVDRLARGFNWVQAVLDSPVDSDQRAEVEGHRIVVERLKLRGQSVRGVLLFHPATVGAGTIVVYTPQAPGGRVFHEYVNERLMSDFVHNSRWRDYLVGRVELASRPSVLATLKGRGDVSMVSMARIAGNVFEDAYEVAANFAINDAAAQATTTGQTDVETGLSVATTVFDVLTMVLPVHVTLPIGLARSLISVFNAVEAANLGDRASVAHHIVRALGEFTGALADGAIGSVMARGPGASVPRIAPDVRRLNPQMALAKKPEGLTPLAGWESQGIYFKRADGAGPKQYFLNERQQWYSILDEGFEEAWRVRDMRKPIQRHYSPIRRNAMGQWEIGTHYDAPALGGISPQRALRDLYPFLGEAQANRVFESFVFPSDRDLDLGLSLVQHLRSGASLTAFDPYRVVSLETLRLRLMGLHAPHAFSGGGIVTRPDQPPVVEPIAGPSRPRPVEPIAGASQPPALPARPVRPPAEQFVNWGQVIDPVELELKQAQLGIYRRIAGDQWLLGREYIKIDQRFYPVLPAGGEPPPGVVMMFDPNHPITTFAQYEQLLWTDLFGQPRLAEFNSGLSRWLNPMELPFDKSLGAYVADAFPTFSASTQLEIAGALFHRLNADGLTLWGIIDLRRTLQAWRSWPMASAGGVADPLSMLPLTVRGHNGSWLIDSAPGAYNRVHLSTYEVQSLLHRALASGADGALRELMTERLVGSHYEMLAGFSPVSELIFRRAGGEQVFWLSLRRVLGNVLDGRQYVEPRLGMVDTATRHLVSQAQASNNLVMLIGGIHLPIEGAAAQLFILRV